MTGAIQGVAAVYQRAEFLADRKAALEAWSTYVLKCAGQEVGSNVLELRAKEHG